MWNKDHYIDCLRLSSDIFPHYSNIKHLKEEERYTMDFAKEELEKAGKLAKDLGIRITMHPGQFNVVGTPRKEVFESTSYDLKMHADILDHMKLDGNSILVVHGGGTYGEKEKTIDRWIENFKKLPENVKKRLVLENDEKNFSIVDCLKVHEQIGIPIVFDNHHFECYKLFHKDEKFEKIDNYLPPVIETWLKRGLRPKFHISEQNTTKHVGAHSDFIKTFPKYYLDIPKKYGVGVDVMVEAKAKEAAILDLYKKYKKDFLGHVVDEIKDDFFEYNSEKMEAKKCSKCNI